MKKASQNKTLIKAQHQLAGAVGDFMRYWGFRRIHGQIWLQIYISQEPLSGAALTRLLKVSKALVSPALSELQKHGLIDCHEVDKKTKKYTAREDVYEVIQGVLKKREKLLIKKAQLSVEQLQKITQADKDGSAHLNLVRISKVESMITAAGLTLDLIIGHINEDHKA